MEYLASLPYIKIEREVTSIKQIDIEHKRTLYLYPDRIVTKHREFSIEEVIDISYRKFGDQNGLLYLHTSRGLFSYTIMDSPDHFVNVYRRNFKE